MGRGAGIVSLISSALLVVPGAEARRNRVLTMTASAYSVEGKQAAGTESREGTAAADPEVLPLGSRVRVRDARGLIGEFVITDTGAQVKGRKIDLYFSSNARAKRFGRRRVRVEILELGEGTASDAREEAREGLSRPRPEKKP